MKYLVLNPKEYTNIRYLQELATLAPNGTRTIFAPSIQYLMCPETQSLRDSMHLCAQRIDYTNGTGKIRGEYLKEANCTYALCGHADHHPTDYLKQALEAMSHNIIPIVFVQDIDQVLFLEQPHIWVYEPHSRIGVADAEPVDAIQEFVQSVKANADEIVLYGGSVNRQNAQKIMECTDGICVGRSSRSLEELSFILDLK